MDLKEKVGELVEKTKEFNRMPPVWAYWAFGIGLILLIQVLRVSVSRL